MERKDLVFFFLSFPFTLFISFLLGLSLVGFGLVLNFVQNAAANMTYWRGDDTGSDGVSFISYISFSSVSLFGYKSVHRSKPFFEMIIYI